MLSHQTNATRKFVKANAVAEIPHQFNRPQLVTAKDGEIGAKISIMQRQKTLEGKRRNMWAMKTDFTLFIEWSKEAHRVQ